MSDEALLGDSALARLDPELGSVSNLNERADFERARTLPAPEIRVERFGTLAWRSGSRRETIRAWTLGAVPAAIGLTLDEHMVATFNGDQISRDRDLPLAAGDAVAFTVADPGG